MKFLDSNNETYTWIDGDTFTNDKGESFRLKDYDTREVERFYNDDGELKYKGGHTLGPSQTDAVIDVQNKGGFNIIVDTGEVDSAGRKLVQLINKEGQYLDRVLTARGIAEVSKFTTPEALIAKNEMGALRETYNNYVDPYAETSKKINDKLVKEGLAFKGLAVNEAGFNPNIHYDVAHRDESRTLTNEAKGFSNQISESWGKGWDGLKEGFWGYLNAIGEVTDSEMLENLGDQGVLNARFRMADAPYTLNNYEDIENVWDSWQWITNNAVMSAPYLIGTFGSFAAAVPMSALLGPAAGVATAYAPISMIYAGQVWNEMEGEKGMPQFLAATTTGIAAATLDRIGMQALLPASTLLSQAGLNRLVKAYAKKEGITESQSRILIGKAISSQKAELMRGLLRLDPDDIAKFSGLNVAKATAAGAVGEGGTELLQEGIQMYAAQNFSETEFTPDEVKNRLINAGLAGAFLGGPISTATNTYTQLKNQMVGSSLLNHDINRVRPIENRKVKELNKGNYVKTTGEIVNQPFKNSKQDNLRDKADSDAQDRGFFTSAADLWKKNNRGVRNFFKNNNDLTEYFDATIRGLGRLVNAAEKSAIEMKKLVQSETALKIFALIGQVTTGVYHSGKNFKQYQDSLVSKFKNELDEDMIADMYGYKTLNSKRVKAISAELIEFGRSGDYAKWKAGRKNEIDTSKYGKNADAKIENLGKIGNMFRNSYESIYREMANEWSRENGDRVNNQFSYDDDYWWKAMGFDYNAVRKNPAGFKDWLRKNFVQARDSVTGEEFVQQTFESIAYRGETSFGKEYSAVGGVKMNPTAFTKGMLDTSQMDGFSEFASRNIFESLNRTQVEGAKYAASTKYFGEGGWKLDKLFKELQQEENLKVGPNKMTQDDINQFAWYTKAIIDSTHGNFNRIENPKLAALNRYFTSLSIFAGLPLSAISSIPETAMIYFNLNNDTEYKTATDKLVKNIARAWDDKAAKEVNRMAKMLDRSGLSYAQNAVVDRLATGERDIAFLKLHESFFKLIGIKQLTQFQRRMNAGFAVDYIRGALDDLQTAPKKMVQVVTAQGRRETEEVFDTEKFNEFEMKSFLSLNDLGINVQHLYDMLEDHKEIDRDALLDITDTKDYTTIDEKKYAKDPSPRQASLEALAKKYPNSENRKVVTLRQRMNEIQTEINDQIETGIYRFVNERIQNPQAANRPLFFQDPHYQLMTQFNGFISTFTANIVPKLWNRGIIKGTKQMKYDTFVLIVTMLALGGASQYLKDLIKFGQPSPYLDGWGYTQRAIYSSGIIGQYERVADFIYPLYPQRDDGIEWLFNSIVGEAGPSARIMSNALGAGADFIEGETERGIRNTLKIAPFVSVLPEVRAGIARGLTDQEVIEDKVFTGREFIDKPNRSLKEFLLG